jgi:hypothetical protein
MKLKINLKKDIDELIIFDIYSFRKALKSIKVTNTEKFIDELLNRPSLLLSCLNRKFDLDDHKKIELNCLLSCNIPLEFSARIDNHGVNCWLLGETINGESLGNFGNEKQELIELLESLTLPKEIVFKTFELNQRIGKSESKFTYSNEN